jgi:hypothetical protein
MDSCLLPLLRYENERYMIFTAVVTDFIEIEF